MSLYRSRGTRCWIPHDALNLCPQIIHTRSIVTDQIRPGAELLLPKCFHSRLHIRAHDGANSHFIVWKYWERRSLWIGSPLTLTRTANPSRFAHTRPDIRKTIVELVDEKEPSSAQFIDKRVTAVKEAFSGLRPVPVPNSEVGSDRVWPGLFRKGGAIVTSVYAESNSLVLDDIFEDPVLVAGRGLSKNPSSRRKLPRLYTRWFRELAQISLGLLGVKPENLAIKQPYLHNFGTLVEEKRKSLPSSNKSDLLLRTWESLHPDQHRLLWMSTLLYVLHEDPRTSLRLIISMMDSIPNVLPAYAAGDTIALVCHTILPSIRPSDPGSDNESSLADIALCLDAAIRFLKCYEGVHRSGSLSRKTIGLITQVLDSTQVERWIEQLRENSHLLTPGDKLNLAVHATNRGNPVAALQLLQTLSADALRSPYTAAACTQMLKFDIPSENLGALRSNMLGAMLELGVRPDPAMRDIMIKHAIHTGDRELAWSIHEQALKNGLQPSTGIYISLLGGIRGAEDLGTLSAIYREVRQLGLTKQSPQLANALLKALYQTLEGDMRPFNTMIVMYEELFDPTPLSDLGLKSQITSKEIASRMQPPILTLQSMIIAWIKSCNDLPKLTDVYRRWSELIRDESARMALVNREPHVSRSFIVKFDRLGARHMCVQVMQDRFPGRPLSDTTMRYGSENDAMVNVRQGHSAPKIRHDVKIWTSLLQSYAHSGLLEEAEHVVRLMKNHGVEPDDVTFEVLLLAYAKEQDIPKAVETLGQKHEAGFDLDEWTLTAIGKIRDRDTLRDSLRSLSFAQS